MRARSEIVVGVDGSGGSDAAVAWAATEARVRGVGLVIVCAIEEGATLLSWLPARIAIDELREVGHPTVQAACDVARRLEPDIPIRVGVLRGPATRVLTTMSLHVPMVVVGRTGCANRLPFALGSVATRLAAMSSCPVVIVPVPPDRDAPGHLARAVVFVDDANRRECEIAFALDEAALRGAEVVIAHATGMATLDPGARDYLRQKIAGIGAMYPQLTVSVEVLEGSLHDAVIGLSSPNTLMVLGHRRSRIARHALGSNIRSVLQASLGPVAVVGQAALSDRVTLVRATSSVVVHAPVAVPAVAFQPEPTQR